MELPRAKITDVGKGNIQNSRGSRTNCLICVLKWRSREHKLFSKIENRKCEEYAYKLGGLTVGSVNMTPPPHPKYVMREIRTRWIHTNTCMQ